ncbi:arginine--tRNA ligase [Candidatus Nomurabacteria bacterium]|nr:MAG: arginine--tRNA ligase [Candidatus Nomurabacteria bacterium]
MVVLDVLSEKIKARVAVLGIESIDINWEHPADLSNGDYSTNIALIASKKVGKNPKEVAQEIVDSIKSDLPKEIDRVEVAGAGFINIYLSHQFFIQSIDHIFNDQNFGKTDTLSGKKVIIEYTDPNPFKEFHIGHLMSNTIGETLSRIIEWNGAEIKRACYQGDVGLHVAKAIFGMIENKDSLPSEEAPIEVWAKFLGSCYALGSKLEGDTEEDKNTIKDFNKKIYDRSDSEINRFYDLGRAKSLEYFEEIYKKLGTKFDFYFFESKTGEFGKDIVLSNIENGVFENGENGAIVFKGEKYNPKLHTRVFINSQGLPTYEAKELGLSKIKFDTYGYDESIVVTGNEINDYFRVLLEAMNQVFPDLAKKTKHISHGMLRLPTGKMSSRTGDVVTGDSLLSDIGEKVAEKMKESNRAEDKNLVNDIAVSALKYSVLKQATGRDIIFDFDKSLSFEGDSGPYLSYSHARARSIIEKAKTASIEISADSPTESIFEIERLLYRFPEVVAMAYKEYAPHAIASYLVELARSFNSFYAETQIVDDTDKTSGYKVMITSAFATIQKNGLYILGIKAPEKM